MPTMNPALKVTSKSFGVRSHPTQIHRSKWPQNNFVQSQCTLYPQKQHHQSAVAMSALCQKRTFSRLFDHLVGGDQQVGRYGQTERLRGLQVDDLRLEIRFLSICSIAFSVF